MGFFDNFNDSTKGGNHSSPFGEAGLLFDPLYYLTGKDKGKYAKFMRKTWEVPNEKLSPYVKKFNKFDRKINPLHKAIDQTGVGADAREMVENKPGDSALAILGAAFGGGALMGGMGGGSAGAGAGGGANLGVFSNGGTAGMGSVGSGNAGTLFANTGINTGGVGGVGGTGAGSGSMDWMQLAQEGAGAMGQGQQPQQTPAPQGHAADLERERQKREREEEEKRRLYAQAMRQQGMYSPAVA